jgi:hypothetical protein
VKSMKKLGYVAAACFALAAPAPVLAKPTGAAPLDLAFSGEGRWAVKCTFEDANGNINAEEFRGGKVGPVIFSSARYSRGTCDYKAASNHPLTIALVGEGWSCPVGFKPEPKCERAVAPGASGFLRLTRR